MFLPFFWGAFWVFALFFPPLPLLVFRGGLRLVDPKIRTDSGLLSQSGVPCQLATEKDTPSSLFRKPAMNRFALRCVKKSGRGLSRAGASPSASASSSLAARSPLPGVLRASSSSSSSSVRGSVTAAAARSLPTARAPVARAFSAEAVGDQLTEVPVPAMVSEKDWVAMKKEAREGKRKKAERWATYFPPHAALSPKIHIF